MEYLIMSELHSASGQPDGGLTQVEVRGLRRDGEGRGLGKHLTTNYGCRTDGSSFHFLEGLPVAVHIFLEWGTIRKQNQAHIIVGRKKKCENIFQNYFYLLGPSSRVHSYGADKLWRNASNGGANRDIRRLISTALVLALAGNATAGKSCRLIHGYCTGLDT